MNEEQAINDAYNTGVQCLFNVLFDGHVIEKAEEAAERFTKGLALLRKTRTTALKIISELKDE